jgi:hypothetical protein
MCFGISGIFGVRCGVEKWCKEVKRVGLHVPK